MPASTSRVRKSTAAAVAAVAGLAIVGTFAIDSSGAADAATTSTATVADVRTASTTTQSDALAQFQRMTAAVAKDAPAKPLAVGNGAQITDSRVVAAQAAEKAAAQKKAAEAKAAEKAAADRKAAAAKQAADAAAAKQAAAQKKAAAAKQQAAAASTPSGSPQQIAAQLVPADQLASFDQIISHESGWNVEAVNPSSGSYGLGQALPASKMASQGADWRTNPVTQIKWALNYMDSRYGSPNAAWQFWQANNWY